jgi:Sensors of blue-light using FAD
MSNLTALVYRSEATHEPTEAELEAVLFAARAFNAHSEVTGVLLLAGGRFFQYLEGPEDSVRAVFHRVAASSLHREVEVLFSQTVTSRMFDTWHMGLLAMPESSFLQIADADWEAELRDHGQTLSAAPAMRALMHAWRSFGQDRN